jgi:zinc/manganese transport system permease protein
MNVVESVLALALLGGALASVTSGILSPFIILTKNTFFAIEMVHAIIAAGVVGSLVNALGLKVPPLATASLVVLLFVVLASELDRRGFSTDTAVGVVAFTAAVIVAIASYAYIKIDPTGASNIIGLLIGSLVLLTASDVKILLGATAVIVLIFYIFWREIVYINFDPEWSRVSGVKVHLYKTLFYSLVALASLALTYTIGVFLAHIVLVAPGVSSTRISKDLSRMALISVLGTLATMEAGIWFSWTVGFPPAAGVGIILGGGIAIAWFVRYLRHGRGH